MKNCTGGVAELAKLCRGLLQNGLVQEGLQVLREKFRSFDSVGPKWVAQVITEENFGEPDLAQREAFELMQLFLSTID